MSFFLHCSWYCFVVIPRETVSVANCFVSSSAARLSKYLISSTPRLPTPFTSASIRSYWVLFNLSFHTRGFSCLRRSRNSRYLRWSVSKRSACTNDWSFYSSWKRAKAQNLILWDYLNIIHRKIINIFPHHGTTKLLAIVSEIVLDPHQNPLWTPQKEIKQTLTTQDAHCLFQ